MPHRCPLCLKELRQDEDLVRYCLKHRQAETFNCVDNASGMFCPTRNGPCNDSPDNGVFLRHINCDAKNPFWDAAKKRVVLPGDDNTLFSTSSTVPHKVYSSRGMLDVEVFHWQIGVMRQLPRDAEEMWFPLMLLRATAEVHQRRRIGALVELAGTKRVGKTVVAVQAMDAKGYVSSEQNGRSLSLKDYIYSRKPDDMAIAPLLDMLYLRDIMERNHAFDPNALGTKPGPGDLKVIFIEPPRNSAPTTSTQDGDLMGRVREFLRDIWWQIKELLGFSAYSGALSSSRPFWYTVMFYDTAGEHHRRGAEILIRLDEAAEKAAVFVNAVELLDPAHDATSPESSITVATRRLKGLQGKKHIECSLVITHLDLAKERMAKEDWEKVRQIAQAVEGNPSDDKPARHLLISWLRQSQSQNVRSMEKLLKGVKVFFIWTEGIPEDESQYKGARTYSFGLARFICWCLGVQWREIAHQESDEPDA
jgi:hypothetical protein